MASDLRKLVAQAVANKPDAPEEEIDDLEFAVAEFFNAKSAKERAQAFQAAIQLVKDLPEE